MSTAKGYVHIIESPAAVDLLEGRTEGRLLSEALQLCGIPFLYNLAVNMAAFEESFRERVVDGLKKHHCQPIFHLSSHGDANGIGLTDGTDLTWADLRDLIAPVSNAAAQGMLLCMSTCYGAHARRLVDTLDQVRLFGVVGSRSKATWPEAAIAYAAFYHRFFSGAAIDTAVEAMKMASGHDDFEVMDGKQLHRAWQSYVAQTADFLEMLRKAGIGK